MPLRVEIFPYASDNYGFLVHDSVSGATASVDAGDAQATREALARQGWTLSQIWVTHHHGDHIAGLSELKALGPIEVLGPESIAGVDRGLHDGDHFTFAEHEVHVLATPGHTLDMLNFYLPEDAMVFVGDTLFVMGCGRMFEGNPAQMHASLQKLAALPGETAVYCAHEYTLANADFALSVDAQNSALVARAARMKELRSAGQPTIPSDLAAEVATNPFLRTQDAAIRAALAMPEASDAEVFGALRQRKDSF